ncbi:MAG: ErfK/YbiS/YcfS/YnhG family protein [Candidatus Paceibacter sp.]|jgi:hypothetical protein|nr:ErfK/YbiS/YcfS/YnhG family protein [Candidatus Paceibacter sp.]
MKKTLLPQALLFGLAIAVYFFSSPSVPQDSSNPSASQVASNNSNPKPVAQEAAVGIKKPVIDTIIETPVVSPEPVLDNAPVAAPTPEPVEYIEIVDSCGPYFTGGDCVNVRSGPGLNFEVVTKLRTGVVLRVLEKVEGETHDWYKITFKEFIRYPERVSTDWYVAADYVTSFLNEGTKELSAGEQVVTAKKIIVDRSSQTMYAYDGEALFMEEKVSTGVAATPTPRGTFTIFKKTPSRYMQGPIEGISTQYYDLPGVPWDLYFTAEGAVFHGAYWHDEFGHVHSNGCVNLPVAKAKELYAWADLGTQVVVRD